MIVPDALADLSETKHPPMPQRPDWQSAAVMTAEQLDSLETDAFEDWKEGIYANHDITELNHFEHNLEVWRQLWRVVERSDIVLLLADARCPALHFHTNLYRYITRTHGKECVLVLTKADLVTPSQVIKRKLNPPLSNRTLQCSSAYCVICIVYSTITSAY
jgi:hypothetical protein